MNSVKLEPFGDFIMLEPVQEDSITESGLVLPDNAQKEKPRVGVVIAVGKDIDDIKVGEKIVFSPFTGEKVEINLSANDHKKYHFVLRDALIARWKDV